MKKLLLLASLFVLKSAVAQESTTPTEPTLIVHKDDRIDALVKKQASINERSKRISGRTMRGYRLMVMNTNNREEAIAAKTKVYTHFPDQKAYLLYQSPFFRLKAGNFKTRDEAKRYQSLMNAIFPKGVFIINDVIEVKPELDPLEE
ncbi:SPOR domain-containing protein [Flavisolibacter sp. BT320]|nr:SPOR domain-containing protein [Flavisolibacter longurius]